MIGEISWLLEIGLSLKTCLERLLIVFRESVIDTRLNLEMGEREIKDVQIFNLKLKMAISSCYKVALRK